MPTDILRDEHRVILKTLTVLEKAASRLADARALPDGWWDRIIQFLRSFADRNHHAKEENLLFPALVTAGVPSEGGPIAVMLGEHIQGRALIQEMEATGDAAQRARAAQEYVHLLRDHIAKEDGILWPLAEAVLDEPVQQSLLREFRSVEAEQGRDASMEHAETVVKELGAALG